MSEVFLVTLDKAEWLENTIFKELGLSEFKELGPTGVYNAASGPPTDVCSGVA
jgi:hypothetical protein